MGKMILNYKEEELIGKIASVDTGTAIAFIPDDKKMSELQINQLIAVNSPRAGTHIIGMIVKMSRRLDEKILQNDIDDEKNDENVVLPSNAIKLVFVGELRDKEGIKLNVFKRNVTTLPNIQSSCFRIDGDKLTKLMECISTIAANAVTNILENLNGVAAQGVGIGLMTIVGQCIGAGRKDEAIYYIKKLSKMAEAAIIISCLVVFALCRPITILGGMEAESARMCFEMTLFITITKPISWVLSFIPAYGMRAAGDVKFSMITSCASMWLCRVSFTIFLCRVYGFGPIAVWIGMFADWTVRGIIFTIRFHSRRWLNHHIID